MPKTLSLSEAKARLSELVAAVEQTEEACVITRNGRPAGVLMSAKKFDRWKETQTIRFNPALMADITEGLRQLDRGAKVSFEDVFGKPLHPKKKKDETISPGPGPDHARFSFSSFRVNSHKKSKPPCNRWRTIRTRPRN